jgi:hypothetical protein
MPLAHVQSLATEPACSRPHRRSRCFVERPSMGFRALRRLQTRSSDLHQAYRTWLCCALRLSQPLDALIPLRASRPCFMPERPWASTFRGFPSTLAATPLDARCPSCRSTALRRTRQRLQGLMQARSPFAAGRCYPVTAGRASHGVVPSEEFPPRVSAPCFHRTSSHGLG